MQRQAVVAAMVLALGVSACAERTPTAPDLQAGSADALLSRSSEAGLTLHPSGFGEHSYAAWKAKEGLPDSRGNGHHALYFQKMTATATFAAAVAIIDGVEGRPVTALAGLSWEHRADGHCGAGAPRWNVGVNLPNGGTQTVFLGCAAAAHTPGSAPGWIRDSYPGLGVGLPAGATLRSLAIVFDEGTDVGQGYVHLDNITVTIAGRTTVFTGPMDNGR